jgi:hypothetical protein
MVVPQALEMESSREIKMFYVALFGRKNPNVGKSTKKRISRPWYMQIVFEAGGNNCSFIYTLFLLQKNMDPGLW